jgi:predicted NBD/HSP70 family sugar kinase
MQRSALPQQQTASNRTPREINRKLLFNLIRHRQPVSRAELARLSGLQRSTVSLIVEELIVDRWILEGNTGTLPRGRRPTLLHLNLQRCVLAIDIHPSQTTLGVVDIGGTLISQSVARIAEDPTKAVKTIIAAARAMIIAHPQHSFEGIGICLPGRTDLDTRKLIFAPNLSWPAFTIKPRIHRATSLRVEMDNVANACALSEVWFGEGDTRHDRVFVNVSEGIGTGIFANGQLIRGEKGMAGEFGHVQLDPAGPKCGCGSNGCWETLASNIAALRYYHKFATGKVASRKKDGLDFHGLIQLAASGDRSARLALEEMAKYLGRGARMIASALAPQEIVIVGDVIKAWDICGPVAQLELARNGLSHSTVLRPSLEGSGARLRSAVALVVSTGFI